MFVATLLSTDPVVFARDASNDIIIPLRKASGVEAVMILVNTALLLWRDEWFLNRDIGTPWIETEDGVVTERDAILTFYDAAKLARALRTEILTVPGAVDVLELKSAFNTKTRNVTVSGVVQCQFADGVKLTGDLAVQIPA